MSKISTRGTAVRDAIAARHDFDTHGSFWGRETTDNPGDSIPLGALSDEYTMSVGTAEYVVYSYRTPIAWYHAEKGWTVPAVKYSATTSRHQSQVRYALAGI